MHRTCTTHALCNKDKGSNILTIKRGNKAAGNAATPTKGVMAKAINKEMGIMVVIQAVTIKCIRYGVVHVGTEIIIIVEITITTTITTIRTMVL